MNNEKNTSNPNTKTEEKEYFSLVTWFRERRTTKIVNLFHEHIGKVIDTCYEFDLAMNKITDKNLDENTRVDEAEAAFKRVLIQERSADLIKQSLFKEISRVKLDPKIREDLFKLINQIDPIANWVKAAAKNALILLELKMTFGQDLWGRFRTISEMILSSARLIRKMIDVLGIDDETLLNIRFEVETLEQSTDDLYFSIKKALLTENLSPQTILLAIDMLSDLENAADHAAGSADILYILVMAAR